MGERGFSRIPVVDFRRVLQLKFGNTYDLTYVRKTDGRKRSMA